MRRYVSALPILAVVSLICVLAFSFDNSVKEDLSQWQLVWEDNFDSDNLDTTKWSVVDRKRKGWGTLVFDTASFLKIQDGQVKLTAFNVQDSKGQDSTVGGGIQTKGKFAMEYCKVEVRAKMGSARGINSAIWMLANKPIYTDLPDYKVYAHYNGEIDILEHIKFDPKIYSTIHTYYTYALKKDVPVKSTSFNLDVSQWAVYGAEIHPDKVCFFLNGEQTFVYPRVDSVSQREQFPFDQPYYLIIEQGIGKQGSWQGSIEVRDLPVTMCIDWVKFYKAR